jgi:hypothetical protein
LRRVSQRGTAADKSTYRTPPQHGTITFESRSGTKGARSPPRSSAANPGATIQRVENDAEGGAEGGADEAHIIKSDGTRATVKLDADFNVTATEAGGH